MRRRDFVKIITGLAVSWPLAARAQQPKPVIGFLSSASPKAYEHFVRAFQNGLGEVGYIDGENISIEYRWAEDQYERLPAIAAELVHQKVAVIFASGGPVPALAAKAATATIPIVFPALSDPVKAWLRVSIGRAAT